MKRKEIEVLRIRPGATPERVCITNSLESFQKEVDGLIEIIDLDNCGTIAILNEEGKILGLEGNRRLYFDGGGYDAIAGTFLIAGSDLNGDICSLSKEKIDEYSSKFIKPELISQDEVQKTIAFEIYFL